jgi:hypothetical protein
MNLPFPAGIHQGVLIDCTLPVSGMDGVMVTAVEISIIVVMGKFDRHVGPKSVSFPILLLGGY